MTHWCRPSMRARNERVGKRQADREIEVDRRVGEDCEEGCEKDRKGGQRREAGGGKARRWRLGGGVHAARAGRASLLAREVGAEHVFVRPPDGDEESDDA